MSLAEKSLIKTVEGFIPIEELVGKEIDVYCMDYDGHLAISTARNFRPIGETDGSVPTLFSIQTTRGILNCSGGQPIFTKNRGIIAAGSLELKDSVVGLNRKMQGEQKIFVGLTSEKEYRSEHRFIAGHYYDITGKDVHHIDGNHMNNYASNLEPLDHGIHSRLTSWNHPDWTSRDSTGKFTSKPTRKPKDTYKLTENRTGKRFKLISVTILLGNYKLFDFDVDKFNNLLADEIIVFSKFPEN